MKTSWNARNTFNKLSFLQMIIKRVFFCLKIENFYLLSKGQKTSMKSGSQSSKDILATNFAKHTHFRFFNINYSCFLNGKSLRFNYDWWFLIRSSIEELTCVFVLINSEVLLKWALIEQVKIISTSTYYCYSLKLINVAYHYWSIFVWNRLYFSVRRKEGWDGPLTIINESPVYQQN